MADDNIRHVNCASDFRIVFAFSDGKLPDYPWRLGLKTPNTPSYNMYVASFDGTTYNNCSPLDDESIMVFVDHHRLVPGILHYYLQTDAPDSLFPDGEMNVTIPGTVNIELWEGPSDGDTPPEVTVIVERLLKGDKGDPGDKGDKGDPGEAGQITSATASIDNTTGTPSVKIELGGTPEKRTIDLKFSGLKGEPGEPDESFVRYDEEQDLTIAQQNRALSNIGLKWVNVPYSLLSTTLDDATYTKLKNAYGIILTDAPSEYYGPSEFICGANNRDGVKVFSVLNLADTSAYIVLSTNHSLTNVRYSRTYDGAVPYDASKTLTSDQQDVALSNIGLNFVHVDYSLLGTTLTDEMFAVLDNAKGIILVNTPSDYGNARVFTKGANASMFCYFVSFATGTTYYEFSLNKSTKYLSAISSSLISRYSILYNAAQSLTNTQKDTVLSNIGLNWIHVQYSLLGTTLDDATYTKLTNAYGIILTDVPSDYFGPREFICGANNSDGTKVFAGLNLANTSAYIVLYANHILTNVRYLRTYDGAVPYDASKALTSAQQAVARTNIGVKSADELLADDDFIAQLKTKLGIG